ncbi:conserved hypothetical protein [Rhodopseudomonas palustris BisB5]|uniref:Uncharacterized protein n=1 Tax=Rhodopseudomonas palustris (strain BisB5) TaxID=316057 RepID=Q139C0_RHOPS|nr:conserved hypothetical protein [Rhodopseudomonas palustris BisB5]
MRDFRDAKAMAQTLREALNAKSLTINHSESLELVARVLGFQDWNVLAARIQSDGPPSRHGEVDNTNRVKRQEVHVDAAILDRYVGFYGLSEQAVMTISRDGDQLISRLTGQPDVPLYGESKTKFFAKIVDAQISFATNKSSRADLLVLHQNGLEIPMKRIDAAEAERIEDLVSDKVKNQSPSPGTEPALRRLFDGLRTNKPNYEEMVPPLAEATRKQLPKLHSDLSEAGPIESIRFVGVGGGGVDVYFVQHQHSTLYWRIGLDSHGLISTAWVSPGL